MTKNSQYQIVIHDVKTGCWEINSLNLPLVNNYTPGYSSIISVNNEEKGNTIINLSAPKWYSYIYVGFKILLGKYGFIKTN